MEPDFKKAVAFSTLSQLGFLFLFCCFLVPEICGIYLFVHAFFKSLLFICVGVLIFLSLHNQVSLFFCGSFGRLLSFLICVSLFCIAGGQFFAGFFVKHRASLLISEEGD